MKRTEAMAALPEIYAEALRLREAGLGEAQIAARLDVPVSAMETLLRLATAKLQRLVGTASETS